VESGRHSRISQAKAGTSVSSAYVATFGWLWYDWWQRVWKLWIEPTESLEFGTSDALAAKYQMNEDL
jgi:hypothetical protein